MKSAVTVSLVPQAKGGPFVFWDDLATACRKTHELGFDAIEIFPTSPDDLDAHQVRHLLKDHQIQLAAMGTGAGWVVKQWRLTDPDPMIRGRARDFIASIIDFAGKLGAPAIIGSMQGRLDAGVTRAQGLAWIAEALEQLGPRAHQYGVPLLLEPLNRYETNVFNRTSDVVQFLQTLRTQNVKILCDLFHMNIEEVSIPETLQTAGSFVGHVHLADSNRHAAGFGHTDFPPIIQALRSISYSGYLSAEVLPLPDPDAAAKKSIETFRQITANTPPHSPRN